MQSSSVPGTVVELKADKLFVNEIPVDGAELVRSVYEFNKRGQVVPPSGKFNADRVGFYTGMQLEEMAETLEAIKQGCVSPEDHSTLGSFITLMKSWGRTFKSGGMHGAVLRADREELLDGCIDQAVVSLGSMSYQTAHFMAAIGEVLAKNAEKCPGGIAQHDKDGKIVKPAGWVRANLTPYLDHTGE